MISHSFYKSHHSCWLPFLKSAAKKFHPNKSHGGQLSYLTPKDVKTSTNLVLNSLSRDLSIWPNYVPFLDYHKPLNNNWSYHGWKWNNRILKHIMLVFTLNGSHFRNPKYNEWISWDFRPPLCTCRLNWAMITSWGWRNKWDDKKMKWIGL